MAGPEIIVYFKPFCGWNPGVQEVLKRYGLSYETRNVIGDRAAFEEMVKKTGQSATPCVEIDGVMLTDVGAEEVGEYLATHGFAEINTNVP